MGTPRLKYNSIHVDFPRKFNAFSANIDVDFSDNRSAYGIVERLVFASRWKVRASRRLLGNTDANKLRRFFEYVKDGSSFELWRDYEFGDGITFDGKSLTTLNERSQATFTRSGTNGTYIDPDTGYVTNIGAADTPRYEAGKFGRGVLLEPASTNQLVRSAEFDNASWTKGSCTITANTTSVLDPAGGNTADILTYSGTGYCSQVSAYTPAASTTPVTVSVWLRSASGNKTIRLVIAQSGSEVSGSDVTVTDSWQRFTFTHAASFSTSVAAELSINSTTAQAVYAWGAQLEGAIRYATSYIPTTSATVSRSSDRLEYTTSHFFDSETRKFSVSWWLKPLFSTTDGTTRYFFVIDSSIAATYVAYASINSSNNWSLSVRRSDNTDTLVGGSSASALTQNSFHHLCMTVDTTTTNGINLYLNGAVAQASSISDAFVNAPFTGSFAWGADTGTGGITTAGVYDDIMVYKRCLTAAEVSALYSKGTGANARRNYFSALRLANPAFDLKELIGSDKWDGDWEFEEVLS